MFGDGQVVKLNYGGAPEESSQLGLAFGFPRSRPKRERMKFRIYATVLRSPIRQHVRPDMAAPRTYNAIAQQSDWSAIR